MPRIHMVNQNKTKLPRNHSGFGPWLIIALIMAIGVASMLAQSVKADTPQCSITAAEFDNLLSEEMAAFIALNPGEYEEGDLQ